MCQGCVEDGHMTQPELDEKILSGDMSVMPLHLLSKEQLLQVLADAVEAGTMTAEEALASAALVGMIHRGEIELP